MPWTVYKITSPTTGKSYIGQSQHPKHRLRAHLRNNEHLFGQGHAWAVLGVHSSAEQALRAESLAIVEQGTLWPGGYNRSAGSEYITSRDGSIPFDECGGLHHTDWTKRKISESALGHERNLGRPVSEETREKMRQAKTVYYASNVSPLRGRERTAEHQAKISAALKGKVAHNKGVPMSPEARERLRLANVGRPAHNKGIPRTQQEKDNIAAARVAGRAASGKPMSKAGIYMAAKKAAVRRAEGLPPIPGTEHYLLINTSPVSSEERGRRSAEGRRKNNPDGIKFSEEARANMRKAHELRKEKGNYVGTPRSEECRRKISEAAKARHAAKRAALLAAP